MPNNKGFANNSIRKTNVLTEPQVRAIRELYWIKGLCQQCIGTLYEVNSATIHDAVNFKTWTHIPFNHAREEIHAKRRRAFNKI